MSGVAVAPDEAFPMLVSLVLPAGLGLLGLVAAGLLGAILSTIDSMLNSASTLFAVDLYRKHLRPHASDAEIVRAGRVLVAVLVVTGALLAVTTFDPASRGNFFLDVARRISYLTPGLLVSFLMGMFWARATARGAVAAILAAPLLGITFEWGYAGLASHDAVAALFGEQLNFMHRTFLTVLACFVVHGLVSRSEPANPKLPIGLLAIGTGAQSGPLRALARRTGAYLVGNGALAWAMVTGTLTPGVAGTLGAALSIWLFAAHIRQARRHEPPSGSLLRDDRLLAGALTAGTTFVLFSFY